MEDGVCVTPCGFRYFCDIRGKIEGCQWVQKLSKEQFDPSKQSILVIDDNPGMTSFLRDDIESILSDLNITEDYNIIEFSSKFAAYYAIATIEYYDTLNITKAVIDITLGGAVQTDVGNIKFNGIDVFEKLYELTPDLKFLFYTGNQLNSYIHSNKELIDRFDKIYHGDLIQAPPGMLYSDEPMIKTAEEGKGKIFNFVLYKTALNIEERREYFKSVLFA
jgi:hypothetical protein